MDSFVFENSTKVYLGVGCVREHLAEALAPYGDTVMLVYGGGSIKKNGAYDDVMAALAAAGKRVVEFPGVMANPTLAKALEGVAVARAEKVDFILAVGGGSVIDCSKAISMGAATDKDIWEEYWAKKGVVDFEPVPLGTVCTIAGTGSEVNGGAVLTNEETNVKTDRDYPKCNPRFSMLDPVYTMSAPKLQMVSSGFDILSHVMETYFCRPDHENVSDDIMVALMRGIVRDLHASIADPEDVDARSNLMWESCMAENRIIKCGKELDFEAHQIEHQMSAFTNCIHGCGLAVVHPVYYRHVCEDGLVKFCRFAERVWDIPRDGKTDVELAHAGVEALADFIKEVGLPTTLSELGIPEDDETLRTIAESVNQGGGYRALDTEEIFQILCECR